MKTKLAVIFCVISLAGCASVSTPDFMDMPEFAEEAKDIKDYPDIAAAPGYPDDIKSDKYWDLSAKSIMRERDRFNAPNDATGNKSDGQINQDIQALKSKVHAYKLDDPQ